MDKNNEDYQNENIFDNISEHIPILDVNDENFENEFLFALW